MKQKKSLKKVGMALLRHLQHINVHAAGIDIGSRSHFVAVPEGVDEKPVREFSGFAGDLERMAEWLIACGVTTVAMESTGVYWILVFEVRRARRLFSVGEIPTRPLSLRPVALGAVEGGNDFY